MARGTVSSELPENSLDLPRRVRPHELAGYLHVNDDFAEENRWATSQIYMLFAIAPWRLQKSLLRPNLVSDSLGSYLESQNDSLAVWHTACASNHSPRTGRLAVREKWSNGGAR